MTERNFTDEMRAALSKVCQIMNEARAAGQTFGFNIGYTEGQGQFVEKLTVTTDLAATKPN